MQLPMLIETPIPHNRPPETTNPAGAHNKSAHKTTSARDESSKLGQEAVRRVQERTEEGRQIRLHHLQQESEAQAEVRDALENGADG